MHELASTPHMRRALCVGLSLFGSFDTEPPTDSYAELPYAGERVARLVESLTYLGYSCATDDSNSLPTADALGAAIISTIDVGQNGDVQVIHILSHGHLAPSSVYVIGADADYVDRTSVAAWIAHIEDSPHKPRPQTLFLLDICHAGAAARLDWLRAARPDTRAWIIAATPSDALAYDGRLTQAAANVLMRIHTGELDFYPSEFVPFGHVVEHIRREVVQLGGQRQYVCSTPVDGIAAPPFFPNKRRPANAPSASAREVVDAATQPFTDLDSGLDEAHFLDRATGHSGLGASVDVGCFTGRENELEALTAWLKDTENGGLRVVTGGPGSGKSALLGVIVCAMHPQLRESTRRVWEHVSAIHEPCLDKLIAIHLRERSIADALWSFINQLDLPLDDRDPAADDVIIAITMLPSPPIIIVDALDEALTQGKIVHELLLPLARTSRPDGTGCCRLLIGMRPWEEFADLHQLAAETGGLIDLDTIPADVLRSELADYIQDLLSNAPAYAERRRLPTRRKIARQVADALTEPHRERGGEFLAGALYTNWLLTRPDNTDEDTEQRIPRTVLDILELDLATQVNNPWLRAVLVTLAYAHGAGMPATVIRRIAPLFLPDNADISARLDVAEFDLVLRKVRFYLRASPDIDGTTLYRLFHQSLADHLRVEDADLSALLDHLLATAPMDEDGTRRWDSAEPYVRRHAVQHAADASRLDELFRAESLEAELAFNAVRTPQGRIGAAIYRESSELFGSVDLTGRQQLLAVNASRYGLGETAAKLLHVPGMTPPEWWPQWSTGSQMASNPLAVLTGHTDTITAISSTQVDGRPVAITASSDATLRMWDLLIRQPIGEPLVGHAPITALACFVLGGRSAAITGDVEGMLQMWDLDTRQPIGVPFAGKRKMIEALACTYLDSSLVAISSDDGALRAWNLETHKYLGSFTGDSSPVAEDPSLAADDPGPVVELMCTMLENIPVAISCTRDETLCIWDLRARKLLSRIGNKAEPSEPTLASSEPSKRPTTSPGRIRGPIAVPEVTRGQRIAVNPGASVPALSAQESQTRSIRPIATWRASADHGVNATVCVVLDGQPVVVSGSTDGTLQAWDLVTRERLGDPIAGQTGSVKAMAAAVLDGQPVVVSGSTDGTLQAWDLVTREPFGDPLTGHTGWANATAIAIVDRNPVAVTGSTDGTIRLWNLSNEKQVIGNRLLGHSGPVNSLECVRLGDRFVAVTGSDDGTVRTWDAETGEPIGDISGGHNGPVKAACAMRKNRPIAVAGSEGRTVRAWDLYPLRQRWNKVLLGLVSPATAVKCTTLNKRPVAIVGTADGRLNAWDLLTGSRLDIPFTDYINGVKAMACIHLNDKPVVIIIDNDGDTQAWSLATGRPISGPPTSEPAAVNAVACCYLAGQSVVVTGSDGGELRIRDLPLLRPIRAQLIGDSPVTAVTCSIWNGHPVVIAGSIDGNVRLWDIRNDTHQKLATMPREVNALCLTEQGDLLVGFGWEVACLRNVRRDEGA